MLCRPGEFKTLLLKKENILKTYFYKKCRRHFFVYSSEELAPYQAHASG